MSASTEASERLAGKSLSARQRQVLVCMGKGFSNMEIGELMCTTHHNVASHVKMIFAKLGVNNRVEAAVWACKEGLL